VAAFPKSEADIVALARDVIGGLTNNPDIASGSPVSAAELEAELVDYLETRAEATAASAHGVQATAAKNTALRKLAQGVKRVLRHAENEVGYNDAKLLKLGWGAPGEPSALEVPGQPLSFRVLEEGAGSITLSWRKPTKGGKVAAYRVERQRWGEDQWSVVGVAVNREITLECQERGVPWVYRVIAVNKTGEGKESNIAKAVL